jgi:hypothetical protein
MGGVGDSCTVLSTGVKRAEKTTLRAEKQLLLTKMSALNYLTPQAQPIYMENGRRYMS